MKFPYRRNSVSFKVNIIISYWLQAFGRGWRRKKHWHWKFTLISCAIITTRVAVRISSKKLQIQNIASKLSLQGTANHKNSYWEWYSSFPYIWIAPHSWYRQQKTVKFHFLTSTYTSHFLMASVVSTFAATTCKMKQSRNVPFFR
jgi:hypothetical protein